MTSRPVMSVSVHNNNIKVLMDTGSYINVLDHSEETYNTMSHKPKLPKTNIKVDAYGVSII